MGVTGAATGLHHGVSAVEIGGLQFQVSVVEVVMQSILIVWLWEGAVHLITPRTEQQVFN